MTYRGVYKDGVVVFEGEVPLRDGEVVEVNPAQTNGAHAKAISKKKTKSSPAGSKRSAKRSPTEWDTAVQKAKKMTRRQREIAIQAAYGAWKNRPDWKGKTSSEIAADLRKRASARGRHA